MRLSKLQKKIIELAESKPEQVIFVSEVLQEVYGFIPEYGFVRPTGINFNKSKIGFRRYNCAMAATSRAMTRLHNKGIGTKLSGAFTLQRLPEAHGPSRYRGKSTRAYLPMVNLATL